MHYIFVQTYMRISHLNFGVYLVQINECSFFLIQDAFKRARGLKDILTCTLYILVSGIQISWQNIVGSFLCSHLGWTEVYSCLQMLFAYKCTLKCHSSIFILLYYNFMIKSANTGCFYCCCFFPNLKNIFVIESFCPCWRWGPRSAKKCLQSSCHAPGSQSRSTNSTYE